MQKRLQAAKQKQKQWTPPPVRLPEAVIKKPTKPVISVKKLIEGLPLGKTLLMQLMQLIRSWQANGQPLT